MKRQYYKDATSELDATPMSYCTSNLETLCVLIFEGCSIIIPVTSSIETVVILSAYKRYPPSILANF